MEAEVGRVGGTEVDARRMEGGGAAAAAADPVSAGRDT